MTVPDLAPLVPAYVDLRAYPTMPLHVDRLCDSGFTATVSAEEFRAGVLLWCKSWHELPAGSLPLSDAHLSKLSGYGFAVEEWRKVKIGALYGWIACSDGRLYHPIVAECVLESWKSKVKHSHDRLCERLRKQNKDRAEKGLTPLGIPSLDEWVSAGMLEKVAGIPPETATPSAGNSPASAGIPPENDLNRKEGNRSEVNGREGKGVVPPPSATVPGSKPLADAGKKRQRAAPKLKIVEPGREPGWTVPTANAYFDAMQDRYGIRPKPNKETNSHFAAFIDKVGIDDAPHVAAHFVKSNRGLYVSAKHATTLLVRDAQALYIEWGTNTHGSDTRAREMDRGAGAAHDVLGQMIAMAKEKEAGNGSGE